MEITKKRLNAKGHKATLVLFCEYNWSFGVLISFTSLRTALNYMRTSQLITILHKGFLYNAKGIECASINDYGEVICNDIR